MISPTPRFAMLLILLAAFCFGIMGLLTKIAVATVSPAQIVFIRSLAGTLFIVIPIGFKWLPFRFVNFQLLTLRGLLGGAAATCYFLSLGHIPLSMAIVLNNTAPIFSTLYLGLLFRQKFTPSTWVALFASFSGVLLIFHPDVQTANIGSLLGLLCGALGGGALISVKKLRETDSAAAIFLAFSVISIFLSIMPAWHSLSQRLPLSFSKEEWWILLAICLVAATAQMIFTFATKYVQAAEAGILGMTTIVFATSLGIIFLGERFSIFFVFGTLLIVGSAAFLLGIFPKEPTPHLEPQ